MPDVLIRGLDPHTIACLDSSKGCQSRDAFLRNLITDYAGREMVRSGVLIPNFKDMEVENPSVLNAMETLYIAGLISYPRTLTRYLDARYWGDAADIIEQFLKMEKTLHRSGEPGYRTGVFGSSLTSEQVASIVFNIREMITNGYMAPSALYSQTIGSDNAAVSPQILQFPLSREENEALDHNYSTYRKLVCFFLMAHWNIITEYRAFLVKQRLIAFQNQPKVTNWIPFRHKETNAIIIARWKTDIFANGGGTWEVAGESKHVSVSYKLENWNEFSSN